MHSKHFIKIGAFFLLFAVFFAPLQGLVPVAHAETHTPALDAAANAAGNVSGSGQTAANASAAAATAAANTINNNGTAAQAAAAGQQAAQQATNAAGQQTPMQECSFFSNWSICLSNVVYVFSVGAMSLFAYVAAIVLDYTLQMTLNSATYAQSFLTQGWAAVRDLANMAFIFILVYIAIMIVLKIETSGTLKALAGVVVMALLINFSFFFTRVVIDAGNILAVQFYNAIPANALGSAGANQGGPISNAAVGAIASISPSMGATKDLTGVIMNATGVHQLISTKAFAAAIVDRNKNSSGVGVFITNLLVLSSIYIMMGAMLAILAMVFVGAGVKFVIRIVMLWLLIVAAPLAFIAQAFGSANKSVSSYFKKWFRALVEFSFFPAFFLFMFWIINLFATQMGNGACGVSATNPAAGNNCGLLGAAFSNVNASGVATTGSDDGFVALGGIIASVGIRLAILIALLYYSLKFSDLFAKQGGSLVHKATGKVGGFMKGYGTWAARRPFAAPGWAARNTVGRGAYMGYNSQWAKNLTSRVGFVGRPVTGALKGLSQASFNTPGVLGVKPLGGKGGFEAAVAARVKDVEAQGKYVKSTTEKDLVNARQALIKQNGGEAAIKQKIADLNKNHAEEEMLAITYDMLSQKENAAEVRTRQKAIKDEIKRLETFDKQAKDSVEGAAKERFNTLTTRIGTPNWQNFGWVPVVGGPSRGSLEGVAKLVKGKDHKTAFAEAAAAYEKAEHGGHEEEHKEDKKEEIKHDEPAAKPAPKAATSGGSTGASRGETGSQSGVSRGAAHGGPTLAPEGLGGSYAGSGLTMAQIPPTVINNITNTTEKPTEPAPEPVVRVIQQEAPQTAKLIEKLTQQTEATEKATDAVERIERALKEQRRRMEELQAREALINREGGGTGTLNPELEQILEVGANRIGRALPGTAPESNATNAAAKTLPPRPIPPPHKNI